MPDPNDNYYPALTRESERLFLELAKDAPNWGGTPLVNGNVQVDGQRAGNLTDLQNKGLISVFNHHQDGDPDNWVEFTALGKELAGERGFEID